MPRVRRIHQIVCECGWEGADWIGKGSLRNAWGEYAEHKPKCPLRQQKATDPVDTEEENGSSGVTKIAYA